ncbi:MAG: tRNA (guanosine(37)-N1)-methyltransferase TrmD [Defluviitaleaceae bacterium]|nr:tRNA (guanosine(37)-N1)-methyltransferase TrmD [Defluviitaleaceae bacterium]
MKFHVLTLFPNMILDGINHSIIARAIANNLIDLSAVNIRDFSSNKHNKVDDYPYGGGVGLVMAAAPIYNAYKSLNVKKGTKVVYLTPKGELFSQKKARELAKEEELILLCGHYEGIDQRVIDEIVTDEISIGDYVLTGGELAAMVLIDATTRLVENVIKEEATANESFENNLLEYPQYTRPAVFMNREVPAVLLNGNHAEIEKFRLEQSIKLTKERRPDLLNLYENCDN